SCVIMMSLVSHLRLLPSEQSPFHFNRKEVKEAMHAPVDTEWTECSDVNVFPDGDKFSPCVHGPVKRDHVRYG
ncbi:hypothetical protein PAXINDRAFT_169969, partial [Paxillus involutus ATCC 200175]